MSSMTPRPLGDASVLVGEELTRRVRALAGRVGTTEARRLLQVSDATWAAARDRGRLKTATRDRIVAKLNELDAETAKGAAAK